MALPLLLILHLGRLFPIAVAAGTALARFVADNPKIIGSTLSIEAISAAIQSYVATEKEKINVVNEIGKENPQLRADLFKNVFYPDTNIVSNIIPYLVLLLIIYYFLKNENNCSQSLTQYKDIRFTYGYFWYCIFCCRTMFYERLVCLCNIFIIRPLYYTYKIFKNQRK